MVTKNQSRGSEGGDWPQGISRRCSRRLLRRRRWIVDHHPGFLIVGRRPEARIAASSIWSCRST